jgi:hypothetical protein
MRVVIEEIEGLDLILLMYLLERFNFSNKEQMMILWKQYLKDNDIEHLESKNS